MVIERVCVKQVCQELEDLPGICWALHNEQLQLPPASTELLQGLASLPRQLEDVKQPALPTLQPSQSVNQRPAGEDPGATPGYKAESQPFAKGGFGEVWRADSHQAEKSEKQPPHACRSSSKKSICLSTYLSVRTCRLSSYTKLNVWF